MKIDSGLAVSRPRRRADKQSAKFSALIDWQFCCVHTDDKNFEILFPNISQFVWFVFRHEEDGTFAYRDVDERRFALVSEIPFSHSNDDLVFAGNPFGQGCARRKSDPNDHKVSAVGRHALLARASIRFTDRSRTSKTATHGA